MASEDSAFCNRFHSEFNTGQDQEREVGSAPILSGEHTCGASVIIYSTFICHANATYVFTVQRDYVWDKKTASKLIESLLLNIPLPTMFFHERSQ